MDVQTIDMTWGQLQAESQQTITSLTNLAQKLQVAAQAGDQNAREWMLDLKEIALGIQNEQNQTSNLLQALHGFIANSAPQQQPNYPQSAPQSGGGGLLQHFMGGGFGRAIVTGAGFGIGDDLINQIF